MANTKKAVGSSEKKDVPSAATLDLLLGKSARTRKFNFVVDGNELFIEFQALPAKEFDDLVAEHPPTKKQKSQDMNWNSDTFYPVLISKCAVDPKLSVDDAKSLVDGSNWSFGELNSLYGSVLNLNTNGVGASFT